MKLGRLLTRIWVNQVISQFFEEHFDTYLESYFEQYIENFTEVLENYETYEVDLTELTKLLKQPEAFVETFVPDAHPEVSSVDGEVRQSAVGDYSWAAIHNGVGNNHWDDASGLVIAIVSGASSDQWVWLSRSIMLFDTSRLPSNALIVEAKIRLVPGTLTRVNGWAPAYVIVSSNPASATDLVNTDYQALGTTPLSNKVADAALFLEEPIELSLNAAGRAAINPDGITKLGLREYNYDVLNIAPPWQANKTFSTTVYAGDSSYTAKRARLIVKYILAP